MKTLSQLARTAPFAHFFGNNPKSKLEGSDDDERKKRDDETQEEYEERMKKLDEKEASAAATDCDGDTVEDDKKAKAAQQAERIRCAAIVAHGFSVKRPAQACALAFDSDMTVEQAQSMLSAADLDAPAPTPASPRAGLRERMGTVDLPNPGANAGPAPTANPAAVLAAQIVAAGERIVRAPR